MTSVKSVRLFLVALLTAAVVLLGYSAYMLHDAFADTVSVKVVGPKKTVDVSLSSSLQSHQLYYQYKAHGQWEVLSTNNYITLEEVLEKADVNLQNLADNKVIQFKCKCIDQSKCKDAPYNKYTFTAEDFKTTHYFYPNLSASNSNTLNGKPVPAVLALGYSFSQIGSQTSQDIAFTLEASSLIVDNSHKAPRLCMGINNLNNVMGKRLPYEITEIRVAA
jgi:hypothetical protein